MASPPTIASPAQLAAYCRALVAGRDSLFRDVRFGPATVRIGFHGFAADADYAQALGPAQDAGQAPAFTIHVVDGGACAIDRPRFAWRQSDFSAKRIVPGWSDRDLTTYLLRSEGGFACADWTARQAVVWLPSADAVPWYERAAPFRWLFDNLAARLGMATLHAAAVGLDGAGVLLSGRGGAGKSTLALACLGSGFDYVADDYCLLSAAPQPIAHRLYATAKWRRDAAVVPGWLRDVAPHAVDRAERKNIVRLDLVQPDQLAGALAIAAIVVPEIADVAEARLEPVTAPFALRHLAASTLAQAELDDPRPVALLGRLARTVPAYRLRMPPDPARSVAAIAGLLARATAARMAG